MVSFDVSLIFEPTLLTTSCKPFHIAFRTPGSGVFAPATSSAINGSTLGVKVIKVLSALVARLRRMSLDGSAMDLVNVRCNCGKKGLRRAGIFSRSWLSVYRIAHLT